MITLAFSITGLLCLIAQQTLYALWCAWDTEWDFWTKEFSEKLTRSSSGQYKPHTVHRIISHA